MKSADTTFAIMSFNRLAAEMMDEILSLNDEIFELAASVEAAHPATTTTSERSAMIREVRVFESLIQLAEM